MSLKLNHQIESYLNRIKDSDFDEDTFRHLLMSSRDFLKKDSLIKEIAHFIAHPGRDRGIAYKKANSRYLKLKLVDEKTKELTSNVELQNSLKSESDYTDYMLSSININKIESYLFEALFIDGIEDLDNSLFIKHYGMSKSAIKQLIKKSYSKLGTYYILNKSVLKNYKLLYFLNDVMKYIRGSIQITDILDSPTLNSELTVFFNYITTKFSLNIDLEDIYNEQNKNDIFVCIIALLHDATFNFYDGNTGRCFLGIYSTPAEDPIDKEGFLCLYLDNSNTTFPFFVSEIKIGDYVDDEIQINRFDEIPWVLAKRINKKLKLLPI